MLKRERIFLKGFKFLLVYAAAAVLLTGCFNKTFSTISLKLGGEDFIIEIARTQKEQQLGLMKRSSLGENRGMLFVYTFDKKMSFWMKNTSVPLSIAYISAEGIIKEIHDLEPFNIIPVKSAVSVRYALELNQGAYDRLGLQEGDRIFERDEIETLLNSIE